MNLLLDTQVALHELPATLWGHGDLSQPARRAVRQTTATT